MKENKRMYTAPAIERIPVEPGMVMASSGTPLSGSTPAPAAPGKGNFPGDTSAGTRATSRDLDNLINDILTVGQ
jgi:hypothetical protein